MLSFLNPWALFGLLAVAIPIIIHLLRSKQKIQRIPSLLLFTNFKKAKPRRKIENIILMILRCLAVALIVLLLARPLVKIPHSSSLNPFSPADSILIVLLDNSITSAHTFDAVPVFSIFKQNILSEIGRLPLDAKVVITGTAPGSPLSQIMNPKDAAALLEKMEYLPVFPDIPAAMRNIHDFLSESTTGFSSFSILAGLLPSTQFMEAVIASGQAVPAAGINMDAAAFSRYPDPYVISVSWPANTTAMRIAFAGDHLTLSNTYITLTEAESGNELKIDLNASNILNDYIDIPLTKFNSNAECIVGIRGNKPEKSTSLSEYYITPYHRNSSPFTVILHDGTNVSLNALQTLYAALSNINPGQHDIMPFNFTNASPADKIGRRPSTVIVPPLARINRDCLNYISSVLSEGCTVMLFPQSRIPGFRISGLEESLQPLSTQKIILPEAAQFELVNTPHNQMEFFSLYSRGFSHITLGEIIPFAAHPGDNKIFSIENHAVLSERHLPDGGTLLLWGIPFETPTLSLTMNPMFLPLLQKLCIPASKASASVFFCGETVSLTELTGMNGSSGEFIVRYPNGQTENFPFSRTMSAECRFPVPGFYSVHEKNNDKLQISAAANYRRGKISLADKDTFLKLTNIPQENIRAPKDPIHAAHFTSGNLTVKEKSERPDLSSYQDPSPLLAVVLLLILAAEGILAAYLSSRKEYSV